MIRQSIVFIVGAGGSIPFDFPSGYKLVQIIIDNIKDLKKYNILSDMGFDGKMIEDFNKALFYSGRISIDSFLEHRTEFIEIGKATISLALIPYENDLSLFNRTGDNWYEYIFNKLNTSFDDFDKNNISIITYNYDRSLEHYLFTALQNSYGKSDELCKEKIKNIKIIHLHGQLGYLPWQQNFNYREYSTDLDINKIKNSSKEIKIIHENIEKEQQFIEANELLKKANAIFFLGFGYNKINLNRLNLASLNSKYTAGTIFDFTDEEANNIYRSIKKCNNKLIDNREIFSQRFKNLKILPFLRNEIIFNRE